MIKYSSMSKTPTTSKNINIFSLVRLRKECHYTPISADFTPISRPTRSSQSILPQFNKDSHFFTSAFVNPYEQSRLSAQPAEFLQNQKEKFLKKIQGNLSSPEQSNIQFNPRGDNYCSICRLGFENYWQHINSKCHLRKIKSSKANTYIQQLCRIYKQKPKDSSPASDHNLPSSFKKKNITKADKGRKNTGKATPYPLKDRRGQEPKESIEKEQLLNCNMNTNGANSLDQKK